MNTIFSLLLFIFLISGLQTFAQRDISEQLKDLESGNIEEVRRELNVLKQYNADDPSIIYLEAVLQTNAERAVEMYKRLLKEYPNSDYADDILYRLYTYNFAIGSYLTADEYLTRLKSDHPESPFIEQSDIYLASIMHEYEMQDINEKEPDTADATERPVEVKDTKETGTNKIYRLKLGAFINKGNAVALTNAVRQMGYVTNLTEKEVGGTLFFIVTAGEFETETDAALILSELNNTFNLDGVILKEFE